MNLNPANLLLPKSGRLLVSKPFLEDPYFKRTVILICDYDEEGTFGFILNKYIDLNLEDVTLRLPVDPEGLAVGGPVDTGNVFYIHRFGSKMKGSIHVVDDIYMGGRWQDLEKQMESDSFNPSDVRFFIGYSGWEKGQLDQELEMESWYVAASTGIDIMDTSIQKDDLWSQVLKTMGGDFVNLANFPVDPSMN